MTYGALAQTLAAQTEKSFISSQAVGNAVGHSLTSIIIPCHRVVSSGDSLTRYTGDIVAKLRLLEHRDMELSHLSVPERSMVL